MATEFVDISTLTIDAANVRTHSPRNLDAIKAGLAKFGQQKPIVIDAKGLVVAGNGTLEAARALGWEKIDVVRTELQGVEATAYAIADNRTSELAEWDSESLAEILAEMKNNNGFDSAATGFTDEDIESLFGTLRSPTGDEWGDALQNLPRGDGSGFRQMSFHLTDDQAELVKSALDKAKQQPFEGTGNPNGNGNALARIAEAYLGCG